MAGPERPPVTLASNGFPVFKLIRIPIKVLINTIPSAPASSTALAISTISVTLGDNFTYTGFVAASLQILVTCAASSGFVPKPIPPCFTLGQEIFNSYALITG